MSSSAPVQAITEARSKFGQSDELSYAELDIETRCTSDPDPLASINNKTSDPSRSWAIRRLLQQCDGVDKLSLDDHRISFQSAAAVAKTQGTEAGIAAALSTVSSSNEPHELYDAGQFLLESNRLNSQLIPGLDQNLGPAELLQAWTFATSLWACDQGGGCGPDSFVTVSFCANLGCPENVSLRDAMQSALPPREMQALQAFYQWINASRN